jgi:hypothetical protein
MPMDFTLTIDEGRGAGQRLTYSGERVTIGRDTKSDLVLPEAGVSRNHARIELRDDVWVLVDGGSANGTELNGVPLGPPQALKTGDRIGVGRAVLRFGDGSGLSWRRALIAAAASALLVLLGFLAFRGQAQRQVLPCPDTAQPDTGQTFGHGSVDVECGDRVVFALDVPRQTRALLHYRVRGNDVALRVNGQLSGRVSSSAFPDEEQTLELPVRAGRALVAFAQAGKEWSVGGVRLETVALPPGDASGARAAYERGRRKLEERQIAPRNLYDAWKAFVEARQKLEEPAAFSEELDRLVRGCERDLAKECSRLLFAAARFERYGQEENAQRTYREALLHFPGDEPSACRKKAQANLLPEVARQ